MRENWISKLRPSQYQRSPGDDARSTREKVPANNVLEHGTLSTALTAIVQLYEKHSIRSESPTRWHRETIERQNRVGHDTTG